MIRTALKPAWLALLALLVAVVISFYQLGMWQLGVSSNRAARELAAEQEAFGTVPLQELFAPGEKFTDVQAGRSVEVTGAYADADQFLVPDRRLEGRPGYWVVTPVRTEQSGSAALLPVVRGFVTDPGDAGRPGSDPVRLTGTLTPSESDHLGADLPEGQRGAIDLADLVNLWELPVYNAFIFLVHEEPARTPAVVERVPPPVLGADGIDYRNLGYAMQWFVFALFAIYMYLRFLRQAAQGDPAPLTTVPDRGETS
ncbi:SURF1 family protein [Ornithinimicrobium sp. Y1847]|uniref:SURF1 family protein n=1 Tax=unclassified Ornithinimicrobium TaxID=2615080 RepID=UPI003B684636